MWLLNCHWFESPQDHWMFYSVIYFRISRDARKLTRTFMIIKKIVMNHDVKLLIIMIQQINIPHGLSTFRLY